MKKILLAVDGSDHAQASLDVVTAIALQNESEVQVIHVVTNDKPAPSTLHAVEVEFADEFMNRIRKRMDLSTLSTDAQYAGTMLSNQSVVSQIANAIVGEQILNHAANDLQVKGVNSVKKIMVEGDPADQIIHHARKNESDVIVMGCRGVSRLKGLVMGSVSQSVAHRADCSVIMVK